MDEGDDDEEEFVEIPLDDRVHKRRRTLKSEDQTTTVQEVQTTAMLQRIIYLEQCVHKLSAALEGALRRLLTLEGAARRTAELEEQRSFIMSSYIS